MTAADNSLSSPIKLPSSFLGIFLMLIATINHTTLPAQTTTSKIQVWKIESKGKGKAFVAASLPFFDENTTVIPSHYKDLLVKATMVGFERNPDSIRTEYQLLFMEEGFFDPDDNLENHLTRKTFTKLEQRLEELNKPLGHHPRMKPWLLALTLHNLEIQAAGYNEEGMDRYFYDKALQHDKTVFSLTSQNSLPVKLAQMSLEKQEAYLEKQLEQSKKNIQAYQEIGQAWNRGEIEQTGKGLQQKNRQLSEKEPPRFEKWVTEIQQLLKNGETVLLFISPEYLTGKNSLLTSFKNEKRIQVTCLRSK